MLGGTDIYSDNIEGNIISIFPAENKIKEEIKQRTAGL